MRVSDTVGDAFEMAKRYRCDLRELMASNGKRFCPFSYRNRKKKRNIRIEEQDAFPLPRDTEAQDDMRP